MCFWIFWTIVNFRQSARKEQFVGLLTDLVAGIVIVYIGFVPILLKFNV
jgi:hypothetical protein